jgi:ABC-type multidrug transport system fused ATPase/permease subunit
VIQIEGVTFGYASKNEAKSPSLPLFADVHLGIEQSSRIALVGPNGSGKVRGSVMPIVCMSH